MQSKEEWACSVGEQLGFMMVEAQLKYNRLLESAKEERIRAAVETLTVDLGRFPNEREVMTFLFKEEKGYDDWVRRTYGDD